MRRVLFAAGCLVLLQGGAASAQEATREEGLAAWDRIYAVASHPRCTNCHVGLQEEPMWNGLGYGTDVVHGMGVKAGESRIGAESMPCRTCHISAVGRETAAHAPAQIDDAWRLPPVELDWLGVESAALCAQLRDPDRNDGFDIAGLAEHLTRSPFVAWGFDPGGGRSAPPGSPEDMARDVETWGAAGTPCE